MADLRDLRLSRKIPAKDMVDIVQRIYPRYDKTMQSKCENGDTYGVMLRPDAMEALMIAFAPEALANQQEKKKERHRMTCRISARLPDAEYEALQQHLDADGKTIQAWIRDAVQRYIAERETK